MKQERRADDLHLEKEKERNGPFLFFDNLVCKKMSNSSILYNRNIKGGTYKCTLQLGDITRSIQLIQII